VGPTVAQTPSEPTPPEAAEETTVVTTTETPEVPAATLDRAESVPAEPAAPTVNGDNGIAGVAGSSTEEQPVRETPVPGPEGSAQAATDPPGGGDGTVGGGVAATRGGHDMADPDLEEVDEEEPDHGDADPARPKSGGLLTRQVEISPRTVLIVLAVVGVLVLAFGAYQIGQRQARTASRGATPTPTPTAPKVPKDYTAFNDKDTGVKLSVPKEWTALSTKGLDPAIRLAVGIPDTNDTVFLRVSAYSSEVTAANIGDQKNVFDQLLGGENINILVNQTTTLRGMPALFYVYRFTDQASGKTGIHAHYFVFQGKKMVSMVFQALPEDRYSIDAPVFDIIANSLVVEPGPPPAFLQPSTSSAPSAGVTTVPNGPVTSVASSPPTSR